MLFWQRDKGVTPYKNAQKSLDGRLHTSGVEQKKVEQELVGLTKGGKEPESHGMPGR